MHATESRVCSWSRKHFCSRLLDRQVFTTSSFTVAMPGGARSNEEDRTSMLSKSAVTKTEDAGLAQAESILARDPASVSATAQQPTPEPEPQPSIGATQTASTTSHISSMAASRPVSLGEASAAGREDSRLLRCPTTQPLPAPRAAAHQAPVTRGRRGRLCARHPEWPEWRCRTRVAPARAWCSFEFQMLKRP